MNFGAMRFHAAAKKDGSVIEIFPRYGELKKREQKKREQKQKKREKQKSV